eukprot:TRINITY_DN4070_c0_g1_i2.p1 TRINITY_DN4070_c0_g1~~TRINITY_DN4070_c0_g1_i2.p1  ORF type:complete len:156 (-),score=24.98 TRINITY_DN4070_c0_g1_i2:23-490(-)
MLSAQHVLVRAVMILRHITLAVLITLIDEHAEFRAVAIVVVLRALMVQLTLRPFQNRRDNVLEVVAIFLIIATFVAQSSVQYGQTLSDGREDNLTPAAEALLLMAMRNLALFVGMMGIMPWPTVHWLCQLAAISLCGQTSHWKSKLREISLGTTL